METIKLSLGKVVLKNGKVSCTCCSCCLYPFPDQHGESGGPFYPSSDLPDTVVFVGDDGPFTFEKTGEYEYTYDTGFEIYYIRNAPEGTDSWLIDLGGSLTYPPCLIVEDLVRDEFLTAYSVEFVYGIEFYTGTIERTGQFDCCWRGEIGDLTVSVCYYSESYKWGYSIEGHSGLKTDPQNSPEGAYASSGPVLDFSVS